MYQTYIMGSILWGKACYWGDMFITKMHKHMRHEYDINTWDCTLRIWYRTKRKQKIIYHPRTLLIDFPIRDWRLDVFVRIEVHHQIWIKAAKCMNNFYATLKSFLSPSHKIWRPQMDVWMEDSSLGHLNIW